MNKSISRIGHNKYNSVMSKLKRAITKINIQITSLALVKHKQTVNLQTQTVLITL